MNELLLGTGGTVVDPFVPPAVEPGFPFQGWVSSDDLIDGTSLAALVSLTSGQAMNNKAGWLKFIDAGKTFYVARKPLRYGTTVAAYKAAGLVAGRTITIKGDAYKIRLLSGMAADPFSSIISVNGGGDWNQYIYPIFAAADRPAAAVWSYYTAADLGLPLNNSLGGQKGWITVCKDQHSSITTALAARGWDYSAGTSVNPIARRTVINDASPSEGTGQNTLDVFGFRPVLEFIGVAPPADMYYGEVADADFITPAALTTLTGMSAAGSALNATSNWLKYRYLGKTVYMAKKPLRNGMSWEQMNVLGLVKGDIPYSFGGKRYAIKIPTGAAADPANYGTVATGGSFNDLIYPIYGGVSLLQPEVQAYPRWAAFTDADLGLSTSKGASGGAGVMTWCQEVVVGAANHLVRGYNDADNNGNRQLLAGWYIANNGTQVYAGWRPVLEELVDIPGAWAKLPNLNAARGNIGSAVVDGKIYTFGGDANDGSNPFADFKCYDPALGTWTTKAAGPPNRTWHCMCEGNGKVYVFAGYNSGGYLGDLWVYDPVANTWAQKASDITRTDGMMTYDNGKLYVAGGYTNGYANDLRCYDIASNTWSVKATFTGGRRYMSLNAVNGKIIMVGGGPPSNKEVWSYDIATNVWTQLADTPMGLITQHKGVVMDGKIYFHGGLVSGAGSKKMWIYDPVALTWTASTDGFVNRAAHFMAAPGDGKIYVGGGYVGGLLADMWVFKP